MKQRNRIWIVLLAGLLTLGLMTGCGGDDGDDGDDAARETETSDSTPAADDAGEADPAPEAPTDAAEEADAGDDDAGVAEPSFTSQTPTGLRATQTGGGGFRAATVELSCTPMAGAFVMTFTTGLGTTESVDVFLSKLTVTVPVSELGKKISYSVYGVALSGDNSQTASSRFIAR